jgi:hypothetical protein
MNIIIAIKKSDFILLYEVADGLLSEVQLESKVIMQVLCLSDISFSSDLYYCISFRN